MLFDQRSNLICKRKSIPIQPMNLLLINSVKYITKNIPTETIQLKCRAQKSCRNLWLTKGPLKSIRKKAKLYTNFLKNLSVAVEKTKLSKLNHLIRIVKRNFYDHKLAASKNDIKTSYRWKILNEVLNTDASLN